jgi:hypothetical protein
MAVRYLPDFLLKDKIIKEVYTELLSQTGRFRGSIEDLKNQLYVDTATWGLDYWEQFLDIRTDLTKTDLDRRSFIKSKLRGYGTVTKNLVQDVAQAYLNGEVEVKEYVKNKIPPFTHWTLFNKATMLSNFVDRAQTETTNFVDRADTETVNFVGKVAGSTVDNPNVMKRSNGAATLIVPTGNWAENFDFQYGYVSSLNGAPYVTTSNTTSTFMAQQLLSFNVIEIIERKHGISLGVDLAAKVAQAKNIIKSLTFNWHGFGSGPSGNSGKTALWNTSSSVWDASVSNSLGVVAKVSPSSVTISARVDANGFVHLLVHAEASNGTIASTINTDYVELVLDYVKPWMNANTAKRTATAMNGSTSLALPTATLIEFDSIFYPQITSLNGTVTSINSVMNNGGIAQQLFSFDIVSLIENKYGISLGASITEKVITAKNIVKSLTCNWHGFGSGQSGNKANLRMWNVSSSNWDGTQHHTNASVTKVTVGSSAVNFVIDANGFVHYLAFADASNGTIASTINTDYVDLVIYFVKPWANNNNSSGAVFTSLLAPTGPWSEFSSAGYGLVSTLNGSAANTSGLTNGNIAQQLFSFDLIAIVERKYNVTIPGANVAEKVTWLKANVTKLTGNWHGYGSGPSGNKATVSAWNVTGSQWNNSGSHVGSGVLAITRNSTPSSGAGYAIADRIDANGFCHFLAYADASNGTIASTINTDYIELIVEANVVSGVTKSDAQVDQGNPYKLNLSATVDAEASYVNVDVAPNTTYVLSYTPSTNAAVAIYSADGSTVIYSYTTADTINFNSGLNTNIRVYFKNANGSKGNISFTNPQLEQGVKTEFEPQEAFTVGIKFVGKRGNPPNMDDIEEAMRSIIPAHLAIIYEFTYSHWDEIQLILQEDFNGLDLLKWDELETLIV